MPTDLKRAVRLNITRSGGTVGRVRVSFGLVYNQVSVIIEVTTRGITEDISLELETEVDLEIIFCSFVLSLFCSKMLVSIQKSE